MPAADFQSSTAPHRPAQRGATLIIGMLLLLMMTLLALLTTSETRTDARVTANTLDRALAFQAAESALIAVEGYVRDEALPDGTSIYDDSLRCFFGEYTTDGSGNIVPDAPSRDFSTWDATNTCPFDDRDILSSLNLADHPVFVIDQLTPASVRTGDLVVGEAYHAGHDNLFRVTVIAYGRSANTQAVLQTVYNPGED